MDSRIPTPSTAKPADDVEDVSSLAQDGEAGRGRRGNGLRGRANLEERLARKAGGGGPRARLRAVIGDDDATEAASGDGPEGDVVPAHPHEPAPAPGLRRRDMVASAEPRAVSPPASEARVRKRHFGILALAFALIFLPGAVTAWYLWNRAVDQYVSVAGFAIRTEQASTPFDFLGAFGGMSSSTGKDMDILNDFVTSQQLVEKLDRQLDLRAKFSRPEGDPVFSYDPTGTIEDLVFFWTRMVVVDYDNSTGLMRLYVYAFSADDAQQIAQAVLEESTTMINALAAVAQADATRYASQALEGARAKLEESRAAMTAFRVKHNIVDPTSDLIAQNNVVNSLTQQLVGAQVDLQILKDSGAADSDPRVISANRKVAVIQRRIEAEQKKVSVPMGGDLQGYADLVAQYERLAADKDFDERAYLTALATYDNAVLEAQHKSVYLATFEDPTKAEASTAPRRLLILLTVLIIGFFAWAIVTMVYYALRDRR